MQRKGKEDGKWDYLKDSDKSLMEKWKEHVKVKKEIGGINRRAEVFKSFPRDQRYLVLISRIWFMGSSRFLLKVADEDSKSTPHGFPRSHSLEATGQCLIERYLSATMVFKMVLC